MPRVHAYSLVRSLWETRASLTLCFRVFREYDGSAGTDDDESDGSDDEDDEATERDSAISLSATAQSSSPQDTARILSPGRFLTWTCSPCYMPLCVDARRYFCAGA